MEVIIRPYRARRISRIICSVWSVSLFCCFVPYIIPKTSAISSITLPTQSHDNQHFLMTNHRQLEEEVTVDDDTFLYNDLSTYSIRYEKCQFVKMYDDELASNQQQSSSPLATKHFVVYRLCPSDTCNMASTSNACGTDSAVPYGTYTMTVEEYLYYTVNYQKEVLEESCNFCNAYCLSTSSSSSSSSSPYCTSDCTNSMCHSCSTTCDDYYAYTTAIVNGAINIVDAANYIQCQKLELSDDKNNNNNNADDNVNNNNNNEQDLNDDDAMQYYIGPYCQTVQHTSSTDTAPTSISIGIFSDENCYSPLTNINMTEVLGGVTLSYHLFKHTTSSTSSSKTKNPMQCLSCLETMNNNNNNNNNNDVNDADNVNEMCENLYTVSAKCESTTGLQNGFIQMHRNNDNNDENEQTNKNKNNQVENEFMVCTFIQSLLYNSYTQTGVIDIRVPQDYIVRTLTRRQGHALIGLTILLVGMVSAIYYYHQKIEQLIHPSMMIMTSTKSTADTNRDKTTLLIRDGEMS
jgi:hypothetical protein